MDDGKNEYQLLIADNGAFTERLVRAHFYESSDTVKFFVNGDGPDYPRIVGDFRLESVVGITIGYAS